jgi:hypothetical protein
MNDQSDGSHRRNCHYLGVVAWASRIISAYPIVVRRARIQAGHNPASHVAHIQIVVSVHMAAERIARGNIQ